MKKCMSTTRDESRKLVKDYKEILKIQEKFYTNLYRSEQKQKFSFKNTSGIFLDQQHKMEFEEFITIDEIFDSIMTLKSGKTPGCDGLSLSFYRKFLNVLKILLHNMFKESYETGFLCPSARRGIINLIPKASKDETFVKNWRPITLLNYDYKIWAKAISNRLETVTNVLIGQQQCSFIAGRSTAQNILRTQEIITFAKNTNTLSLIVSIDFEKCFDHVEYDAIRGTFEYFNFGPKFINMIFLLFNNFEVCTINNGHMSQYFKKTRSVNQGCPASPQIYLYCGEIMTHMVNQNAGHSGINVPGLKDILSQFADDTTTFLSFDQKSLECFCHVLTCIENQIGLKVSYEKNYSVKNRLTGEQ